MLPRVFTEGTSSGSPPESLCGAERGFVSNDLKCEHAPLSPMIADWVTLTPESTL
jgi:hypothetical protein